MRELIYGRNPVFEALRAGRRHLFSLKIAEGLKISPRLKQSLDLCKKRGVSVESVRRDQLDKAAPGNQGVILETSGYPYVNLADVHNRAQKSGTPPFILILDALQDPQNLGTLVRTAEAVGVHGIIIPPRNSAKVTPAVVSASSGATEHMYIAQANLASIIQVLKEDGLWIIGLDHGPESRLAADVNLSGPIALVVGSEGQGMRRLVRDSCDMLLRLPMVGQIESLNAAIAGSVALYMVFQTR